MVLLLLFLMLLLGLFALFLGGGLVAQGFLYQNPVERLPARAAAAALVVAGFMTLWVRIDQGSPGRYDTFFNFTPTTTAEFQEFEAVRWPAVGGKLKLDAGGNPTEVTAKFKQSAGGQAAKFVEEGTGDPFLQSGTTSGGVRYMTGALRVKTGDDPEPVRYNATTTGSGDAKTYTRDLKFVEEKGSRYIDATNLGTVVVPSTGTVVIALLLNVALVVVWLIAFWPILRFSLGHAVMFAGGFAMITMLAVMPVLFKQARLPKAPPPAPAAAALNVDAGIRSPHAM